MIFKNMPRGVFRTSLKKKTKIAIFKNYATPYLCSGYGCKMRVW